MSWCELAQKEATHFTLAYIEDGSLVVIAPFGGFQPQQLRISEPMINCVNFLIKVVLFYSGRKSTYTVIPTQYSHALHLTRERHFGYRVRWQIWIFLDVILRQVASGREGLRSVGDGVESHTAG